MGTRSRKKLTPRQEAAALRTRGSNGKFTKADPSPTSLPRHTLGARAARAREVAGGELVALLGGGYVDPDDHLFRSTREGIRDLPPYTHQRQIELAFGLYVSDPLARFIVESTTDHVVGQGLTWKIDQTEAEVEAARAQKAAEEKAKAATRAKAEQARQAARAKAFAEAGLPPAPAAPPPALGRASEALSFARTPASLPQDTAGFFLPIPEPAAAQFPRKSEDTSPPHVTVLFLGPVTRDQFVTAAIAARAALASVRPFMVEMADYGEFANPAGDTIAHMVPRAPDAALERLQATLRGAVEGALYDGTSHAPFVCAQHPGPMKPHATLAYVAPSAPAYDGPRPAASWTVREVELWGFGQRVELPLFGEARAVEADPGTVDGEDAGGDAEAAPLEGEDGAPGESDADAGTEDAADAEDTCAADAAPDPRDDIEPTVEEIEAVLKEHWLDPDNNWPVKGRDRATALGLWGEVLWPAFVAPATGRVKLGRIDSRRIESIRTDPENDERATHAVLSTVVDNQGNPIATGAPGGRARAYRLINEDDGRDRSALDLATGAGAGATVPSAGGAAVEVPVSPGAPSAGLAPSETIGYLTGDAFYFAVNKVQGARRGHSDIFHLIDWIDALGNLMFDMLDAAKAQRSFLFDVLLKGATPAAIKQWLKEHGQAPKPGAVRAHNESETWTPISPELKGSDHAEFVRVFRAHILGGAGIPEHWFGQGDVVNRAGGEKTTEPAIARLDARRALFMRYVEMVLHFAIDQAILAGRFGQTSDGRRRGTPTTKHRVHVVAPEMAVQDVAEGAGALAQGTTALTVAEDRKWITRDTARAGFASIATHAGVKVDPAQEKAAVEAQESADREAGAGGPGHGEADAGVADAGHMAALHAIAAQAGARAVVPPGVGDAPKIASESAPEPGVTDTLAQMHAAMIARESAQSHALATLPTKAAGEDEVNREEFREEMAAFRREFASDMRDLMRAREMASVPATPAPPPPVAPSPLAGAQLLFPGAQINMPAGTAVHMHAREVAMGEATLPAVERVAAALERIGEATTQSGAAVSSAIASKEIPVPAPAEPPRITVTAPPATVVVPEGAIKIEVANKVDLVPPAKEKRTVHLNVDGVEVTGTVG